MGGRGGSSGLSNLYKPIFEINSKGFPTEFYKNMESLLSDMDSKYNNYIYRVMRSDGAFTGEGGSIDQGGTIEIKVNDLSVVLHEFAHGIAMTHRDDNGLSNNKEFWKEIRNLRTKYRKAVEKDYRNSISTYANSGGGRGRRNLDEFMAEGFAMSYAKSHNIKLNPSNYNVTSQSIYWANEVKKVVDRYFRKGGDDVPPN